MIRPARFRQIPVTPFSHNPAIDAIAIPSTSAIQRDQRGCCARISSDRPQQPRPDAEHQVAKFGLQSEMGDDGDGMPQSSG
jgi:hypothetical protein